jgi:two-component system cell cycle sensor histidine kinase/response regulator CckA
MEETLAPMSDWNNLSKTKSGGATAAGPGHQGPGLEVRRTASAETEDRRSRDTIMRHNQDEKFSEADKRNRVFVENSQGLICAHDLEGTLLFVNQAGAELLGYKPAELTGKNGRDLVAPGFRPFFDIYLQRVRVQLSDNGLLRLVTKSGEERILMYRNVLRDGLVFGHALDITEQVRAEEKGAEWKNRYEAAILTSRRILYDWDPSTGEVTFSGDCERILGYDTEEMSEVFDRWMNVVHPEDKDRYSNQAEDIKSGKESFQFEYRVRKKDGTYIVIQDEGYFVAAGPGSQRMVGFIEDISERKQLEAQLLHLRKMESIGNLAGGIAHDFNNLLTAIIGNIQLALLQVPAGSPVAANLLDAEQAGKRAADLIRQLLIFSRREKIERKRIDLNSTIEDFARILRRIIGDNVEMRLIIEPDLPPVFGDRAQIEQVVMNLAVNARDAMPKGGLLTIETRIASLDETYCRQHPWARPGSFAEIAVTDTGIGMDDGLRPRIFEPFFTTKEVGKGTGLGLAVVYGIVEQHDGLIRVSSNPECGTTFEIYLPLRNSAVRRPSSPEAPTLHGG